MGSKRKSQIEIAAGQARDPNYNSKSGNSNKLIEASADLNEETKNDD